MEFLERVTKVIPIKWVEIRQVLRKEGIREGHFRQNKQQMRNQRSQVGAEEWDTLS